MGAWFDGDRMGQEQGGEESGEEWADKGWGCWGGGGGYWGMG